MAREKDKEGVVHSDFTEFTCVRDPQSLRYYYRSYENQTIQMLDLKKLDLNAKEVPKLSTKSSQPIVDMSVEAK